MLLLNYILEHKMLNEKGGYSFEKISRHHE